MTFRLPNRLLQRLIAVAREERRPADDLIEEASRWYLGPAGNDDLSAEDVAQTQLALVPELTALEEWTEEERPISDKAR